MCNDSICLVCSNLLFSNLLLLNLFQLHLAVIFEFVVTMCGFSRSTWILILAVCTGLWWEFVKKGKLCNSKSDLTGKTVIVTGANVGIGYETALALSKQNGKVIIACRNLEKAKNAVDRIKASSGNAEVDYLIVDFAKMSDIKRAVKEFISKEDRLDILINNAAMFGGGKTEDGLDTMFGVNHIGYFMFTNLLMPVLRKTSKKSPVRIINVSSEAYKVGTIDFDNLNPNLPRDSGFASLMAQYGNTKLMNVYFTSELDARLKDEFKGQEQAITTYSLHPGSIQSDIGSTVATERGFLSQAARDFFMLLIARPTVYGAQTSLCCAMKEGIEIHSGRYFADLEPAELYENAMNHEIGKKLWTESEKLTGVQWGS